MKKLDLTIRNYQDGDEEQIVSLLIRFYRPYIGYVPRTVQYWRWNIYDRPGVDVNDILVVISNKSLVGYSALDPKGNVLEMAIDPNLSEKQRERIANELIHALENRARVRDLDSLRFFIPEIDHALSRALHRNYYRSESFDCLQWIITDLLHYVRVMLEENGKKSPEVQAHTFFLHLEPGDYNFTPHQNIGVDFGPPLKIENDPVSSKYEISINTDLSTLTDMVFKEITPANALSSNLIEVEPNSAESEAKKFLDLLVLSGPWYTPFADTR